MIRENAEFFMEKNMPVHITLENGEWFNGSIVKVDDNKLIIQEDKLGLMPIHLERINPNGIRKREKKNG